MGAEMRPAIVSGIVTRGAPVIHLSLVTVPVVIAIVNSAQFLSRY